MLFYSTILKRERYMPKNNAVTKEDLRNEINTAVANAVAELTKLIIRTTSATEAKLTAEMDRRFTESLKRPVTVLEKEVFASSANDT
jgi:hypothetical protein